MAAGGMGGRGGPGGMMGGPPGGPVGGRGGPMGGRGGGRGPAPAPAPAPPVPDEDYNFEEVRVVVGRYESWMAVYGVRVVLASVAASSGDGSTASSLLVADEDCRTC